VESAVDPQARTRARAWAHFRRPSRWSLRARLISALVGLLALVSLSLGVTTTVALQHFLLARLDDQLVAAGGLSSEAGRPPRGGSEGGTGGDGRTDTGARFLLGPGHPPGTLGARLVGGRVTDLGVLSSNGQLQQLPAGRGAALAKLPTDSRPRTQQVSGLGSYRLVASRMSDGDIVVTGLPLRDVKDTLYQLAAAEAGVALLALLGAAAAGAAIVRRALRPLARVAATAARVSTLTLERGEVDLADRVAAADTDRRTEVGQVGAALNRLLDHVGSALTARQASESRVRQFLADASHELRTPLAAIRGYAEVTRRSREAAPPELAHAMSRVESEAARMTTLVEDLLLLARLDEGRPLAVEPVDLSRLMVDAVSDASAAGPDHHWRLDLAEEPVTVHGDAARLHQVVANLLANARTHTPPGTTVTARLTSARGKSAELCIRDDGPGIPAPLLPTIFERFARGDASRTRGAGSTGLGLAIVQAIVTAHGGTVQVTSRPGDTTFVVTLPDRADATGKPDSAPTDLLIES
jgi:two-component system OmpR family sensor kinase